MEFKNLCKKWNELKEQFMEMGQLKSDFDIEKFTVLKNGNFIAHNFHFLMRQYSLAIHEAKRMILEKETKCRKIEELNLLDLKSKYNDSYVDIEIAKLQNDIDLLDITLVNKVAMCDRFEKYRLRLIELNNNTVPTNEQYQQEEPNYLKWNLTQQAINQNKQVRTGIQQGVWDAIDLLEAPAIINENFQVKMLDSNGLPILYNINNKAIGENNG